MTTLVTLAGCAGASEVDANAEPGRNGTVLVGAHIVGTGDANVDGRVVSVHIKDGVVVALGDAADRALKKGATRRDVGGKWLAPAFIDSHVHLVYWDVSDELPAAGIAAVVDLAAPSDRFFGHDWGKLRVIGSGPMITAVDGYPTTSWGSDGYGAECANSAEAVSAIEVAFGKGAKIVKLPFGAGPELPDEVVRAAVAAAHHRHLPVAAHALSDAAAKRAADLGADVLAHVPVGPMSDATIAAWSKKRVIPTLAAFGGSSAAVENVRRLRAAGATILYGTDMGNDRVAGIDPDEIALMQQAGMDGAAILKSGTADPAAAWGFAELGVIAVGKRASLLVLERDPRVDPGVLATPTEVVVP